MRQPEQCELHAGTIRVAKEVQSKPGWKCHLQEGSACDFEGTAEEPEEEVPRLVDDEVGVIQHRVRSARKTEIERAREQQ